VRVLFVYKDYYPVLGGIEHHVQLLAEGLQQQGVDVRVLVTNTDRRTVEEAINGVPVTKTGRVTQVSSAPISLSFYPHFSRASARADIAHLHSPYPPAELGQLFLGRSRRFVLTYHSDIVRQRVLGLLYRPFLWQVLRRADRITISNPTYIQTSPFLRPFAHKCKVIHHGIDLSRFQATPQIESRAAEIRQQYKEPGLVLFVGRLRHYKGVDVLIKAMQALDARLLIVGTGPMAAVWKQEAAACKAAKRITFLGEVPEEELVALYHAADVFALPATNRAETWGTVQIEAMACALPIVSTELGTGTSYVNRDGVTGFVIPPRDPLALASALHRLLDDGAMRRQMGEAGRRRAPKFSKESMLEQMMAFYQDVLAGDE